MNDELLNIEIGNKKFYPANVIANKISNIQNTDIELGHIIIQYEAEKKHKHFVHLNELLNLKELPIQILKVNTIPSCRNNALKLLEDKVVKSILENVEKDHNKMCILDDSDIHNAHCSNMSKKNIINSLNKIFKSNKMEFKALSHEKGIKIMYRKIVDKSKKDEN